MSNKRWVFSNTDKTLAHELASECQIEPLMALLMLSRGIDDPVEIDEYFCESEYEYELDDPYFLKDMDKAVLRINNAIENKEKITIFGDYDVDGITATSILYKYLIFHEADVDYYIPNRTSEGYGINQNALDKIKNNGTKLIITVDNGINAIDEINYGNSIGIDFVVTDHHLPGENLPLAIAVVDPFRNDNETGCFVQFAGVGVVLKLLCALEQTTSIDFVNDYIDLVALGSVADMVPLIGENRILVKLGLKKLNEKCPLSLTCLLKLAGVADKEITATTLSFVIAPRINAAGRMGDCNDSFNLLNSNDPMEICELAEKIEKYNNSRKEIETDLFNRACSLIENDQNSSKSPIIVVGGNNWHEGVLGIVAGRLANEYQKPAFVFSFNGEKARGSARSIGDINIFALVNSVSDTIESFGGHKMALGVNAKKSDIPIFENKINEYFINNVAFDMAKLNIDCKLNPAGVTLSTASLLKSMEPFGHGNPTPIFGLMGMKIEAIHPIGNGKHLALNVSRNNYIVRVVCFGYEVKDFEYRVGDIIDLAVKVEINIFRGNPNLSVILNDIRPNQLDYNDIYSKFNRASLYLINGQIADNEKADFSVSREEVGNLYRYLKSAIQYIGDIDLLMLRSGIIDYIKLIISLKILDELGFITVNFGNKLNIKFKNIKGKRAIEGSSIYKKVNSIA